MQGYLLPSMVAIVGFHVVGTAVSLVVLDIANALLTFQKSKNVNSSEQNSYR